MKRFLAIFATVFVVGVGAQAGFLIDPYMSYIMSGKSTLAGGDYNVTGSDMGARVGWSMLGFGVGVDAAVSGTYTYKDATTTSDATQSQMGLFVSYKFPILFRGYASYMMNIKGTASTSTVYASGTKMGVQYTGLPFIALGVEMFTGSYKEIESGGSKSSTTGSETQTRLALSVPFDLL